MVLRAICANEAPSSLGTIRASSAAAIGATQFNLTGFSGSNYVPVNSVIYHNVGTAYQRYYFVTAVASVNSTTCTVTVDPPIFGTAVTGSGGSGDSFIVHADGDHIFATIQTWITFSATTGVQETGECYKGAPYIVNPGASSVIAPVKTNATAVLYRHLKTATNHHYNPVDRTGCYITNNSPFTGSFAAAVDIREDYFRFEGFGIVQDLTSEAVTTYGIRVRDGTDLTATTNVQILRNFVRLNSSSASSAGWRGIYITANASSNDIVRNCIVTSAANVSINGSLGIYNNAFTATLDNNSVYGINATAGSARGIVSDAVGAILRNNISMGTSGTISSDILLSNSPTVSYCLTEDTSLSTGYVGSIVSQSVDAVFNNALYDDLRLKYTSPAADTGTNLSASFTVDFTGATRTGLWERGAYNGVVNEPSSAPTIVINSIGTASRDYATIALWEAATRLHLVDSNTRYIGELYDDSEFDHAGTEVTISGAVCDATRYRELRAASGQRYDPVSDLGVRIKGTNGTSVLKIAENFFRFSGAKLEHTSAGNTNSVILRITTASDVIIDGLFLRGVSGGILSSFRAGLYSDTGSGLQVSNCICIGAGTSAGISYGFYLTNTVSGALLANCVAYNIKNSFGYGFLISLTAQGYIKNCISVSNNIDFYNTSMEPYMLANCSSDTTAIGQKAITGQSASTVFSNVGGNDFRLLGSSPAVNAGVSLQFDFTTDITGATRTAPWEMGAYNGIIFEIEAAPSELLTTLRLATCWKIERKDGQTLYVTDHNSALTLYGEVYSPAGGFNASVVRREAGAKADDTQYEGIITSDLVTHEDLFAGLYSRSKVTEYVVDWRYPWASPQITAVYWIRSVSFDEEIWSAEVAGLSYLLQQPAGNIYTRQCKVPLYSTKCGVAKGSFTSANQSVTGVTDRTVFAASGVSGSFGNDYFKYGILTWKTGDNVGVGAEVRGYATSGRVFTLQLQTPFDIQVGDTFDVSAGCDHTQQGAHGCKLKFNNLLNYRGFREIPGTDAQFETPMR